MSESKAKGLNESGLTAYRRRRLAERKQRLAELRELRKQATVEVRDGRRFKVVRVPDRYEW